MDVFHTVHETSQGDSILSLFQESVLWVYHCVNSSEMPIDRKRDGSVFDKPAEGLFFFHPLRCLPTPPLPLAIWTVTDSLTTHVMARVSE
jgi:hypothetical protein